MTRAYSLLSPQDPPAFDVLNVDKPSPCLLTCEHASSRVPACLNNLGLSADHFNKHYAVDIGVREMTERLAAHFGFPAILANYSRLVVDLNRRAGHPSAFPTTGEGTPIPANLSLTDNDRAVRMNDLYQPYHHWLESWINSALASGTVPAIISIHSFTPVFHGEARPWEIAAVWTQDQRISTPFMEYFRKRGYTVGDNEPYDGRVLRGGTMEMHGDGRRLPNLLIEYRNDLLQDPSAFEKLVAHTCAALEKIFSDSSIFSLYDGEQTPYDPVKEDAYLKQVMRTINDGEKV